MKNLFVLIIILLSLISCDTNTVSTQQFTFKSTGWPLRDKVNFKITAPDTIKDYNLFINLRNNNQYAYSNLWIVAELKFPQGKVITDTLQYEMTKPDGSFLGVGSSGVYENKLWLKEGVRFRESGTYNLNLRQIMRKNNEVNGVEVLSGVLDVGYSIENKK